MSIKAEHQLDNSFLKNVSHGAVAPLPGESIIAKYVAFLSIFAAACVISDISTDA